MTSSFYSLSFLPQRESIVLQTPALQLNIQTSKLSQAEKWIPAVAGMTKESVGFRAVTQVDGVSA